MDRATEATVIASELEAMLSGDLSPSAFREKHAASQGAVMDAIRPCIDHYLDDEDIRASDPDYREMQEGEMRKLIKLLRTNRPDQDLARITFLAPSRE